MAVINSYPVTLKPFREVRIAPAIDRGPAPEPQRKLTNPELSLSAKQRAILEWLQSNEGAALVSKMPRSAGLLSLHSLMERGLVNITVEFSTRGKLVMSQLSARERAAEKRSAILMHREKGG